MNNKFLQNKTILLIFLVLILIVFGVTMISGNRKQSQKTGNQINNPPAQNSTPEIVKPNNNSQKLVPPIDNWSERITKKPFGIYITPKNSPISPEHFIGYHTGVDFEVFSNEQNTDVQIFAVCDGPLVVKKHASGYGGIAVQQCKLDNQDIIVVYGHLKLSSVDVNLDQLLSAGERIGILGKGFSTEIDNERKHLHLSIHKGKLVDIRGYVQTSEELNDWIDITKVLTGIN